MEGIQLDVSAVVEEGHLNEEEAGQIEGGETFYIYGVLLTGVVFCGLIGEIYAIYIRLYSLYK